MLVKLILRILSTILFICLWSCKETIQVETSDFERITIDESIDNDAALEEMISPYRNKIMDEMNKPLAYNAKAMFKTDTPYNTAIGNMMADAVLEMANPIFKGRHHTPIDAVLLNYGGIRAGMGKGVVTTRTAFEIMPFENMVVVAELDASAIQEMFEYLSKGKAHPISNMSITIDDHNKLVATTINGKDIEPNKTYRIATTSYQVEGGDNMNFFLKAQNVYDIDYKLRNLFIDYFDKQDTINYSSDSRFTKL